MQDLLLRQNVRENGGTFHLQRHLQSLSSSETPPAEVQADNMTLSTQVQADLMERQRRRTERQQQTGEAHRSLISRATTPIIDGLFSLSRQSSRVFHRTGADTPSDVSKNF